LLPVDFFGIVNLICDKFQPFVCVLLQSTVKAGPITNVALASIGDYFENQAILVTIDEYLFYFLDVAALLALLP